MKKLLEEILSLETDCVDDDYRAGFEDGLEKTVQLINDKWEKLKYGFEYPTNRNNDNDNDKEKIQELEDQLNEIKHRIRDLNFYFNGY